MLDRIRNLLVIMEEGSMNRAANRLGIAQPTLSRQIQSLEQELGGLLLDRGPWGVRPTDLGYKTKSSIQPVIRSFDLALAEVHAEARGRKTQLRVGYLGLSAARYLNPALALLRAEFPDLRVWLLDQTPGEQISALDSGELDVALIGQEGAVIADAYYTRRIDRLRTCVALPDGHPLAQEEEIPLSALKGEAFIGPMDEEVPGRNEWTAKLCEQAGFRQRIIAKTSSLGETFSLVVGEQAVALFPDYHEGAPPPGIAFTRLLDKAATWDFLVLRQRGRGSAAAKRLVELLARIGSNKV